MGRPVRGPGAIYKADPTKSTNRLYSYACQEGNKMGRYADGQTVDYPAAKDAGPPLVGLPIGAGPEGPHLLSHVGNFEDCVLRQDDRSTEMATISGESDVEDEALAVVPEESHETHVFPVRTHRKGASVGCVRELMVQASPSSGEDES